MINRKKILKLFLTCLFAIVLFNSCAEDGSLAPYIGSPGMSKITIESGSTAPRITWVGGYVTVLGVNKGNHPALDSSLIWLIYFTGDQIRYPVTYGVLPAGAQDITTDYGGVFAPELIEDSSYSFWVMKQADWNVVSSNQNVTLNLDSTINSVTTVGNTINLPPTNYTQLVTPFDNYINISEVSTRGRLANIFVEQPSTDNSPRIRWEIIQPGVTDTLMAVIGICASNQFDPGAIVWEVYSIEDSSGTTLYGKENVIPGPLKTGDQFPGTFIFTAYPENGLERNQTYYLYIANENWNGENHGRTVDYYSYVTFNTY